MKEMAIFAQRTEKVKVRVGRVVSTTCWRKRLKDAHGYTGLVPSSNQPW